MAPGTDIGFPPPGEALVVGGCVVEPARDRILRDGSTVHVEPRVMELLVYLCARAGEVVTKDDLLRVVWRGSFVSEHVLSHAVWQLRTALGDPDLVESIPKRGYRLGAEVRRQAAPVAPVARTTRLGRSIPRVAVLPLVNLTGDALTERFADALGDALTTALAQDGALHVVSRTSTMQFRNAPADLPRIAESLRADAVVEGAVLIEKRRVSVSARLIDPRSDTHCWAGRYERTLGHAMAVQRNVARIVAREVMLRLGRPLPGARGS
jgi:TolB-like protein